MEKSNKHLPHLLFPQPSPLFEGHKNELNEITENLSKYKIFFIVGFVGIGKTSLASKVANQLIKEDKSEVVWIQCLKGWDIDTILYHIIDILSRSDPERVPFPDEFFHKSLKMTYFTSTGENTEDNLDFEKKQRIMGFISLINDSGFSIFIDDFELIDRDEARRFIVLLNKFIRGSRIIFVSRENPNLLPLESMDIFILRMDCLNREECTHLVNNLLRSLGVTGTDREVVNQIWKISRGHPLFVRNLVGEVFTGKADLKSFSPYQGLNTDFLNNHPQDSLDNRSLAVLFVLSILRIPIDENGLISILRDNNIRKNMEDLSNKFIIDIDSQRRYYIHTILRDYYSAAIPTDIKNDLHYRCAEYYSHIVEDDVAIDMLYLKEAFYHFINCKKYDDAVKVFTKVCIPMQRYCQYGELESMIDLLLNKNIDPQPELYLLKARLLLQKGKLNESVAMLKMVVQSTSSSFRIRALIEEAKLSFLSGDIAGSLRIIRKAIRLARKYNEKESLISALKLALDISLDTSQYKLARKFLRDCRNIPEDSAESTEKAELMIRISVLHERFGEINESLDTLDKALNILKHCGCEEHKTDEFSKILGTLYYIKGDYDKAAGIFKERFEFAHKTGNLLLELHYLRLQGLNLYYSGNKEEGIICMEHAAGECLKWGFKVKFMIYTIDLGVLYINEGEFIKALDCFKKALPTSREIPTIFAEIGIRSNMIKIYLSLGRIEEALQEVLISKNLLDGLKTARDAEYEFMCNLYLAEIYYRKGETDNFESCAEKLSSIRDSVGKIHQLMAAFFLLITGKKEWGGKRLIKKQIVEDLQKLAAYERLFVEPQIVRFSKLEYDNQTILLITESGTSEIDCSRLESIRNMKQSYRLYFDSFRGEVFETSKGSSYIGGKRILVPLLSLFMKNPGQQFTAPELYEKIWNSPYDRRLNYHTVRTSVSRLRDFIEPEKGKNYYIETKKAYKGEETAWLFKGNCNFCFIGKSILAGSR